MFDILRSEAVSKWIITGSLATQEVQLAVNIKANGRELDPTRVFSADKAIACVAQGIDLTSCQNHDKKQVLVIEIDPGQQDSAKEGEQNHAEASKFTQPDHVPCNHAHGSAGSAETRSQVQLTSFLTAS